MNLLAYRTDHIYLSLTLIYGALISASNSIWGYQIVRYIVKGKFNLNIFMIAIWTSLFLFVLMRTQILVNDKLYLMRMISHDSTALTTTNKMIGKTKNPKLIDLGKSIIKTQNDRIARMEKLLKGLK